MTTATEAEYDLTLEPEILTEHDETKTLPCRQCRRPCVVNRFASPAKTECLTCRSGRGANTSVVELQFNEELETEVLTDKAETKELPCRECHRRCVVNRSATPAKVECLTCRGSRTVYEFDDSLEPEVLTDKAKTKELPCRKCGRRCVVTLFKSAADTECNTCRGVQKQEHREKVLVTKAASIGDISKLEFLIDGIMNPVFKNVPLCPFDQDHEVELKSITHTPHYGPRHFVGYVKGYPKYEQETGECVVYQCNTCRCVISFSTQHPLLLRQNEQANRSDGSGSSLAAVLGARAEAA